MFRQQHHQHLFEAVANQFSREASNTYAGNGFGQLYLWRYCGMAWVLVFELTEPADATSVSFVLDMDSEAGLTRTSRDFEA